MTSRSSTVHAKWPPPEESRTVDPFRGYGVWARVSPNELAVSYGRSRCGCALAPRHPVGHSARGRPATLPVVPASSRPGTSPPRPRGQPPPWPARSLRMSTMPSGITEGPPRCSGRWQDHRRTGHRRRREFANTRSPHRPSWEKGGCLDLRRNSMSLRHFTEWELVYALGQCGLSESAAALAVVMLTRRYRKVETELVDMVRQFPSLEKKADAQQPSSRTFRRAKGVASASSGLTASPSTTLEGGRTASRGLRKPKYEFVLPSVL